MSAAEFIRDAKVSLPAGLPTGKFSPEDYLRKRALAHPCSAHPFFAELKKTKLTVPLVLRLLRNYDVHASALRRLLLKAASLMPEPAVCFVLENVRNEYGNGDPKMRHQLQLQDLAFRAGVDPKTYFETEPEAKTLSFIDKVTPLYYPVRGQMPPGYFAAAICAGAIAATEILAVCEFQALKEAFAALDLADHIWFDHVSIEEAHTEESCALALYFIEHNAAMTEVEYGLDGVLNANLDLYDGLLQALTNG